jgi:hypothetical protein
MTTAEAAFLGGTIFVAITLTGFASRALLWLLNWRNGGYIRLVIAHALIGVPFSWGMAVIMADDIGFATALAIFGLAQLFWLAVDLQRPRRPAERKQPKQPKQPKEQPIRQDPHFNGSMLDEHHRSSER